MQNESDKPEIAQNIDKKYERGHNGGKDAGNEQNDGMNGKDFIGENRALRFDIFDEEDHVTGTVVDPQSSQGTQTVAPGRNRKKRCNGRAVQTETLQCELTEPNICATDSKEAGVQLDFGELSVFNYKATEQDFREHLKVQENELQLDNEASDGIGIGDIVAIRCDTRSENPGIKLPEGLKGCVRNVDSDGNAMVFFPGAPFSHIGHHWLAPSKCVRMRERERERS